MATRVLPGAYVTLQDLSQFPEGQTSLTVGYVVKANRGAVNEATLVTSPTDFLTKYTFSGVPSVSEDPTFWSVLKVLARTNQVYIVRAANNPKFGGIVVKKAKKFGNLTAAAKTTKTLTITIENAPIKGDKILIKGTGVIDGYYTVDSVSGSSVVVEEELKDNYNVPSGTTIDVVSVPGVAVAENIDNPENYQFTENDLMLITGIDAGAYNGEFAFDIISSYDNQANLVYENTVQLVVRNANTNAVLETFTFSRNQEARAIDGSSLFVDAVVNGSVFIKVINNTAVSADELPTSTIVGSPVKSGAGSDGEAVNENTLVGALNVFADKTIPISILGNGCSPEAETSLFQQAMLELANTRKDLVAILNSRATDENATLNSTKAANIVEYKKGTLASTSFYGAMYAPHVKTADTFNSRQVKIGSDAIAIAGWLDVINNLNYPYAYAGPQNGLVTGCTCDWKIGDESGEAQVLNDASINYVAYDGKVGRYYMQCQNTLQIANSSLRNLGCVFNVLDVKEHISTMLKEYNNLPITDALRRDILNNMNDYLNPMIGTRAYNLTFQDVTTEADIAQDTLRYLLTISLTRYSATIYCAINVVGPNFDFSIIQSA